MTLVSSLAAAALVLLVFAAAVHGSSRRLLLGSAGISFASGDAEPGRAIPAIPSWLRSVWPVAVGMVCGWVLSGVVGGLAGLLGGLIVPHWLGNRKDKKSRLAFDEQLPDAISTISAGIRAGLSLTQAIRYAAQESTVPLGTSLAQLIDRVDMGSSLDASLAIWADSHQSADLRLVASVLQLHRRTGGDLPKLLDDLAATLRERESQARESRSLTAQARLSGMVLGFLPVGFFVFLTIMSPGDMSQAYKTPVGVAAILAGFALEAGAFFWIRKILRTGA